MTAVGDAAPRRLIVLGSTGSIGTSTLAVVDHLRATTDVRFEIIGLVAGENAEGLAAQARQYGVEDVALADPGGTDHLHGLPRVYVGADAAERLVVEAARPGDLVVAAMVGAAGVPATLAAIERGCDIALANKETLVAAGAVVMPAVRRAGVQLLPIDSEHSALFQCLPHDRRISDVRRVVLTASGGPFRTWPADRIAAATVDEALDHPTWDMGPKVTIDSASLMNKAMELIEAHWLFDLPPERIEAIVHPQSMVHGLVEFIDGSIVAQLGPPDMRTPIQHALTWPRRCHGCGQRLDWTALRQMEFEPVDHERFPAVRLAGDVLRAGGTAGAVFNAANEAAVTAFLARRVPFGQIPRLVADALASIPAGPVLGLEDIMAADRAARALVEQRLAESGSAGERRGADLDASASYQ